MIKVAKMMDGRMVEVVRVAKTVRFSAEPDWVMVCFDFEKPFRKRAEFKWMPAATRSGYERGNTLSVDQYFPNCYNTHIDNKGARMFYIIAKGTGHIVTDGPRQTRAYKTFGAARATRTRLCNKAGWSVNDLTIVDTKHYQAPMVEKTNLMTGKKFMEDVNTPYFCSPSSESYWSM